MNTPVGPFWYRVELQSGNEPYCYFGRSQDAEPDILSKLESGAYIRLEDIVYFDEDQAARSWTDWDANFVPRILINPRYVISIMPMSGDPRMTGSTDHKILNLPGASDKS